VCQKDPGRPRSRAGDLSASSTSLLIAEHRLQQVSISGTAQHYHCDLAVYRWSKQALPGLLAVRQCC